MSQVIRGQVSWTRQFGLALALFTLGTGAYWLEYKHKPEKEDAQEQAKKLFSIKGTQVKSLALITGSQSFSFTCSDFSAKLCKPDDNSKWEILEPSKIKGDDSNINALLTTLNTLTSTDTIDLKEETPEKKAALLKEYGLDPESRKTAKKVKLATATGETILFLGAAHPMGESVFAVLGTASGAAPGAASGVAPGATSGVAPGATSGAAESADESRVFLVPNFFKANFDHDLTHWRNKKLFSLGAHDVSGLKLWTAKTALSAQKKDQKWTVTGNVTGNVDGNVASDVAGDAENINSFLSAATFLVAKNFASDQKDDAKAKATLKGLSEVLRLTLEKEKGDAKEAPAPIVLTYFQKKAALPTDKLYATLSNLDPLFELDPSALKRLDKTFKDLRITKLITSMDRFETKRLEFESKAKAFTQALKGKPLLLTLTDGKWLSADPTEAPADKIQGILEKLSGNSIKEFYSGSAIPAGEADGLRLTLGDEKTPAKRKLVFWKKAGQLYARDLTSNRAEAFLVDSALQEILPWEGFPKSAVSHQASGKSDSGTGTGSHTGTGTGSHTGSGSASHTDSGAASASATE